MRLWEWTVSLAAFQPCRYGAISGPAIRAFPRAHRDFYLWPRPRTRLHRRKAGAPSPPQERSHRETGNARGCKSNRPYRGGGVLLLRRYVSSSAGVT
jgi:hypothetical protein